MKTLIVGYGSAGRRHKKLAESFGMKVKTVDPYILDSSTVDYRYLGRALEEDKWDICVICTPPHLHLEQIVLCLNHGAWVLCEKPLCDLGEYDKARKLLYNPLQERVMVAYNYRFHPIFDTNRDKYRFDPQEAIRDGSVPEDWTEYDFYIWSEQHRSRRPSWGYLLDNISHSLDMIASHSAFPPIVEDASHIIMGDPPHTDDIWIVQGRVNSSKFQLVDRVSNNNYQKRRALIRNPGGDYHLGAEWSMFVNMWKAFLDHYKSGIPPISGIESAIVVQRLLEDANRIAEERG